MILRGLTSFLFPFCQPMLFAPLPWGLPTFDHIRGHSQAFEACFKLPATCIWTQAAKASLGRHRHTYKPPGGSAASSREENPGCEHTGSSVSTGDFHLLGLFFWVFKLNVQKLLAIFYWPLFAIIGIVCCWAVRWLRRTNSNISDNWEAQYNTNKVVNFIRLWDLLCMCCKICLHKLLEGSWKCFNFHLFWTFFDPDISTGN